jgi:hypothetical protein
MSPRDAPTNPNYLIIVGGSVCAGLVLLCFVIFLVWLGRSVVPHGTIQGQTGPLMLWQTVLDMTLCCFCFSLSLSFSVRLSHTQTSSTLCVKTFLFPRIHSVGKFTGSGFVYIWFISYDFVGFLVSVFCSFPSSSQDFAWYHFSVSLWFLWSRCFQNFISFRFDTVEGNHSVLSVV